MEHRLAYMIIRHLTDQNEVYAVARVMTSLTLRRNILPDQITDDHIADRLVQQFNGNPRFVFIAAFNDLGAAMGYICGEVREDFYTGELAGFELLWLVGTPFRKSGAGLKLLEAWEQQIKSMGAVRSYMGLNEHNSPEILRSIYPKVGYKAHSASYQKPL